MRPIYNFGLYHWENHRGPLRRAAGRIAGGALLFRSSTSRIVRAVALVSALRAVRRAGRELRWVEFPWELERYRYDELAADLPLEDADRLLDLGCGTGRSLVGLAPSVPGACRVVGVDVFDERVIRWNSPTLAVRNAAKAGLDVTLVAGDAGNLPVATDSQDVVTACRLLHDLPADHAARTLEEANRVLRPGGSLGLLEVPLTHGTDADPLAYWRDLVTDAGFEVTTARTPDPDDVIVLGEA